MAFLNFHHHHKNQFIPLILSWHTANFWVLRLEWPHPFLTMATPWPREFSPISQEPNFSQVWDLCKNTAININFTDQFPKKLRTKFSNNLKNGFFSPKIRLSCTPHGPLSPCWVSEKQMSQYQENFRMEGQTLIHRTLPATVGGPIK